MTHPTLDVHGIGLEIGRPPKLALFDHPDEVPVPSVPTIFLFHFGRSEAGLTRPLGRLREALFALLRHTSESWMTQVTEPSGFAETYQRLVTLTRTQHSYKVLAYLPTPLVREVSGAEFDRCLQRASELLSSLTSSPSSASSPSAPSKADNTAAVGENASALELAQRRRSQLLKEEQWLDSGSVHRQQTGKDPDSKGAKMTASRLRGEKRLLGVFDDGGYRHPAFQFHPKTGLLMEDEMKTLLSILPPDRSGWEQAFWLFQPHALLDGARPADVFQKDPAAVLEAARSTYDPAHRNW